MKYWICVSIFHNTTKNVRIMTHSREKDKVYKEEMKSLKLVLSTCLRISTVLFLCTLSILFFLDRHILKAMTNHDSALFLLLVNLFFSLVVIFFLVVSPFSPFYSPYPPLSSVPSFFFLFFPLFSSTYVLTLSG